MSRTKFKNGQQIKWPTIVNGGKIAFLEGEVIDEGTNQKDFGFMAQGVCKATGKKYREVLYPDDQSIKLQ